jgi:hypothetical protein
MEVPALLDKHFLTHGNWQGLSLGQIVVVWLSYILSEGNHRLNSVQGWAAGLLITLDICLKTIGLRELDFSDDRLRMVQMPAAELQEPNEKLNGIYAGNPKWASARPTTEMLLRAFVGISLVIVSFDGIGHHSVSPLNAVQSGILALLGSSTAIYQGLALQFMEVGRKMGEP